MAYPIKCPLCKAEAVTEVGEGDEVWLRCEHCRQDDPVIKAASKALRERGEIGLGLFTGIPHDHYERIVEALTREVGELRVHMKQPPTTEEPF